jgi:hypothetical protein
MGLHRRGFEKSAPSLSLGKAGEFQDDNTRDTAAFLKAPVPSQEFDPMSGQKFWRLFRLAFDFLEISGAQVLSCRRWRGRGLEATACTRQALNKM